MRDKLRVSLQLLSRASHSVTDLLSRAMPLIWGAERVVRKEELSSIEPTSNVPPRRAYVWLGTVFTLFILKKDTHGDLQSPSERTFNLKWSSLEKSEQYYAPT